LADIFNDQQNKNYRSESDADNLNSSKNLTDSTPSEPERSIYPTSPLPDFDSSNFGATGDEDELPDRPVKTSVANPSHLGSFLAAQRSGDMPPSDSSLPDPSYPTTPAEATGFAHYPLPPDEPPAEADDASTWQTVWSIVREVGETVILTLIIFFVIQMFVRNFRVVGTSMVNNLQNGQYLIIDKISYNPYLIDYLDIGGPKRGDVVVFRPPRLPSEDYVKRVIGLSGDKVQIVKGQVFINDEPLAEPFEPIQGSYSMGPIIVPEGEVFVLGDNRNNSNDSHNWGSVPVENIVGRAWISYWPPDQWGTIPRDAPTEQATLKHFIGQFIPSANAKNE
jgi:signal peptidase I